MFFIIFMDLVFRYKYDGNMKYILIFNNINIRAQVCYSFIDCEKAYIIVVFVFQDVLKVRLL